MVFKCFFKWCFRPAGRDVTYLYYYQWSRSALLFTLVLCHLRFADLWENIDIIFRLAVFRTKICAAKGNVDFCSQLRETQICESKGVVLLFSQIWKNLSIEHFWSIKFPRKMEKNKMDGFTFCLTAPRRPKTVRQGANMSIFVVCIFRWNLIDQNAWSIDFFSDLSKKYKK